MKRVEQLVADSKADTREVREAQAARESSPGSADLQHLRETQRKLRADLEALRLDSSDLTVRSERWEDQRRQQQRIEQESKQQRDTIDHLQAQVGALFVFPSLS